jgi:hypothetical protein
MSHNDVSVLDLAKELRRLANGVVRDVQRESELSCLSHIAAIKPLAQLLSEVLSPRGIVSVDVDEEKTQATKNPIGFPVPQKVGQ